MKILGVSGSPREGSTCDQLVKEVLEHVDGDTQFISLAGKTIGPCIACLGCVRTNICVLDDDLKALREAIVDADAYVIGGVNYFNMLNGLTHCFLERWYQFRHREGKDVAGKPAIAVGVGGGDSEAPLKNIQTMFEYNQVECIATVQAQGPACCFTCGYGETCKVGAIHMFFGAGTEITDEIIPHLGKQPGALKQAEKAAKLLNQRLKQLTPNS